MPTILLIRHAENEYSRKMKLAGRMPGVGLTENGRLQVQKLVDYLRETPIKAIYSSPMDRTMETAQPLAESHNLQVQLLDGLLEMDYGEWQGKTIPRLRLTKLWKIVQHNPSQMQFPGGETFVSE